MKERVGGGGSEGGQDREVKGRGEREVNGRGRELSIYIYMYVRTYVCMNIRRKLRTYICTCALFPSPVPHSHGTER